MTLSSRWLGVLIVVCLAVLLWSAVIVGVDRALQLTVSDDPGDPGANMAAQATGLFLWAFWATGTLFILVPVAAIARRQ